MHSETLLAPAHAQLLCNALNFLARAGAEAWQGVGEVAAGNKHNCCIVVAVAEVDAELGRGLLRRPSEGVRNKIEQRHQMVPWLAAPGASTLLAT